MVLKDIFTVVLIVLVVLIIYHTATHGRRGRRWGGN
jgi:uncharacterized membrane protein